MTMIYLYNEIVDLMSESARLDIGEKTQMPSAQLVLHCARHLELVPEEQIVSGFVNRFARHAVMARVSS